MKGIMVKMNEELLLELNTILPVPSKDLRTSDEKNAEIARIIEIWKELPNELQNEELFLQVIKRVGGSLSNRYDIESVLEVYENSSPNLKTRETYNKMIRQISSDIWLIEDFKVLLEESYRPYSINSKQEYIDFISLLQGPYYQKADFIREFVPTEYQTSSFFEEIFNLLDGSNYVGTKSLWKVIPEQEKSQELFLQLCRKSGFSEIQYLVDIVPEEYFDEDFTNTVITAVNNERYIGWPFFDKVIEKVPKELLSQEFYSAFFREYVNHFESNPTFKDLYQKIPDEYKTSEMALFLAKRESTVFLPGILDNTPQMLKTDEFYSKLFINIGSNPNLSRNWRCWRRDFLENSK